MSAIVEAGPKVDVERIRRDFPILERSVRGHPLVYLDNAATMQKPSVMVEALQRHYLEENANIHRGVHYLGEVSTDAYDRARETVRRFLNAEKASEIVFTRGATESINLVAQTFGEAFLGEGDEIVVSAVEHHANLVPWQLVAKKYGCKVKVIPLDRETLQPDFEAFAGLLNERTRLVALSHASNALGVRVPVESFIEVAHAREIPVLIDGCQSVPHDPVDVSALGAEFFVFSGHKIGGPTGIGVLYGKEDWLEKLPPYQGGGDMIIRVRFEKSSFQRPPQRFEAGTPHIAGAVGLAAALEYVDGLDRAALSSYEAELERTTREKLQAVDGLELLVGSTDRLPVFSFTLEGVHPHDLGTFLDTRGVAIRAGHHCAQPLMKLLGVPSTARASFAFYNTFEEADRLVEVLHEARKFFA